MSTPAVCIIVDDNEINRLTLEHMVELTPELVLAASLPGSLETLQYFRQGGRADILLLDIEMPHLSGLELARLIPSEVTVIVVTTHREFAVDAFELRAADYLVKPVEFSRFTQAIKRVLEQRSVKVAPQPEPVSTELFVKVGTRMVRLDFNDVYYIEALSTYSIIVTKAQKHIVYLTLKAITERLPFAHFVRVHRSYIINTQRIDAIEDNTLKLGPYAVPIGKSYQEAFYQSLREL
ncbi:LytR/AlgR family response regulator transcription factor [Hymenobacter mucosus]|uniref:Two component transcriptional regulator, LytTR family n=1 Tax=Hymenobacter mucosus TaxID=1411120 RepID=A0A238Z5J9_9BACT|nr:LytTR family DNA-binding domain-containing protein [Hymenobacter mucosus]SNR78201.1 two component transcriptional regulator, LytTR family [Hymenobacter mucosus]